MYTSCRVMYKVRQIYTGMPANILLGLTKCHWEEWYDGHKRTFSNRWISMNTLSMCTLKPFDILVVSIEILRFIRKSTSPHITLPIVVDMEVDYRQPGNLGSNHTPIFNFKVDIVWVWLWDQDHICIPIHHTCYIRYRFIGTQITRIIWKFW